MRIILFVVFYVAAYVARIAIGEDVVETMPRSSVRRTFERKSEAARSGISEVPVDDGIIHVINKRSRQSLLTIRTDDSPQNESNDDLKRAKRSLKKRGKRRRNSGSKITRRRNNHAGHDSGERNIPSKGTRFPIWQAPESTIAAINLDSTTNPTIMETGRNNRSSFAFQRLPLQLENLNYGRSVNKTMSPITENQSLKSRGLIDVSNNNLKRRFLLVPVSKNLYVLKNIKNIPRARINVPKQYNLLGKNENNATPAILSFKAQHDVKDVGGVYLQRGNHRIFDYDTKFLYSTLDSRVPEEAANSTENPASYPKFLYPGFALRTRSNLIGTTTESFEYVVTPRSDYANISSTNIYDDAYSTATFETYDLTDEDFKRLSTKMREDKIVTDFINDILTNTEGIDKDSQEYGISSTELTHSNFDYKDRFSYEALLGNTTADMDLSLDEDFTTVSSLLPNTDKWKKAQSNIKNTRDLLTAIKPLSSELQRLLNAVKLVNQSLSDVQNRLCDKKNVAGIKRHNKLKKATNIANSVKKVDDSDLYTGSCNSQSLDKRRIKTKVKSVTDAKTGRKTNSFLLNKLTIPFRKHGSSVNNSKVQNSRKNLLKKRRLRERGFLESKDIEKYRLSHSRFNRNLKFLAKNYEMRTKPIRQLIEAGLKETKRATAPVTRSSRFIKSNISSEINSADRHAQNYQENNQISRSITLPSNAPSFPDIFAKENSVSFSADQRDFQRNGKRTTTSEISRSDKETTVHPTDSQFYREATAYLGVLQLLDTTHVTDMRMENLTESSQLIFTTTELSALTFPPYFIKESTTTSLSTVAEEEALETTESLFVTMTSTLPLFYTTELTALPVDEAAILTTVIITEKMTVSPVAIIAEVTETPITIPITDYFTILSEPTMLLTQFLEGMTDITMKITIPVVTEISTEQTSTLIEVETVEDEVTESTSTILERTQSLFVETDTPLYTFSTVSLLKTTETEWMTATSPIELLSTIPTITKGFRTTLLESTYETLYDTTAFTSSSTVLERTGTILKTSTEVAITTLIPEDENPVAQIEKTITAEETATEIPPADGTLTPTESTISGVETTTEISTSTETTADESLTINETLTAAEIPTPAEITIVDEIPAIIKPATITEIFTSTESSTSFKTTIIKEATSAESSTTAEATVEFSTTEMSTSTETTTETLTTVETFTGASAGTLPTSSTIPTTVESTEITETAKIPTTRKRTASVKVSTSTIVETPSTIETPTITESSGTAEVPMTSTKFFAASESTMSSESTTSLKNVSPTSVPTTLTAVFTTATTESTLISSTPTTAVETVVFTLTLTTITPLEILITNATLSETPYTAISSILSTTEGTSLKTVAPTTSLETTMTTPLSPITRAMSSETPSTTFSTFLIEESTAFPVFTPSLETFETTTVSAIFTTESPTESFPAASFVTLHTTVNVTISSATANVLTTEIESAATSVVYSTVTTSSVAELPLATPVPAATETTVYDTASPSLTTFFSTETESAFSTGEPEETKKFTFERYYESTKEENLTSTTELITEEYTTWIEKETPTTYLSSTPFLTENITEATSLTIETTTSPTTASTLLIEKISTVSEATLISTETSTMPSMETSALVPTITAADASRSEKTNLEITEVSRITIRTTERSEYATIEAAVTPTPFSESILSVLITHGRPAATPEIISVLPKTTLEELTTSTTTEIPSTYSTESSSPTSFVETTVSPTVSASAAITQEIETEYYVAKEPLYEEEYEEYDEIPTGNWYDYDEYATTTKYTKLPEETTASSPFAKDTSLYVTKTSTESTTSKMFHIKGKGTTSSLETSASSIIENLTKTIATDFTMSGTKERMESTTLTFGSTEEYILPPSTVFRIPTEPLEYLTITDKYALPKNFTQTWSDITMTKFVTEPEKSSRFTLEKITVSEGATTETGVAEKLTSFIVSPALTTLTEKETFGVYTTIMSTASSEIEGAIETDYEITTSAMTEKTTPRVEPLITPETEAELIFTTTSETHEREEGKEQLLRRLEDLKNREKVMTEREEKLRQKEKQWTIEKEKCRKIMQREKEKAKNDATAASITTFITKSSFAEIQTTPFSIAEEVTYATEKTEEATTTESTTYAIDESEFVTKEPSAGSIETTTFYTGEIYTASYASEATLFNNVEEVTSEAYTAVETATDGSTFAGETEETIIFNTTETSASVKHFTGEIEEFQITNYVTFTPYATTPIVDVYNAASIETVTLYTVKEIYTPYVTFYSEPLFGSTVTSPITTATDEFITLPAATFSERFEETDAAIFTTPIWYSTEETYSVTYTDIYGEPLFTSPTFELTTTSSTSAIITTAEIKYDGEIERLKEKLRNKARELEEREQILQEEERRLEKNIIKFEKYMENFQKRKTSVTPIEKSTAVTSSSTPVPPTEKTTVKMQLTTQIKKTAEKKENRMTTKMATSQQIGMEEEKQRTKPVPEEAVTQKEEEAATKRICLNVLKSTNPLDERKRNISTKKICLPYFPDKNEEKPGNPLGRKLLALQSTRKIRRPRWNIPLETRCCKKINETIHKIGNLQLSHHEWLSNESTKPLRHFKGFTRIYTQGNATSDFQFKTSVYEHVLNYEFFQPTTMSMSNNKERKKRTDILKHDLIPSRKINYSIDDKVNVQKRDVSSPEKDSKFRLKKSTANIFSHGPTTEITEKDEFYTVNVLQLRYNENEQTHEVISAKPNEAELTETLSESKDDNHITEFRENGKITASYYKIEKKDNLKKTDKLEDETEKEIEEADDYIEDTIDNYMNYEEHETSTRMYEGLFNGKEKNGKLTESVRTSLDRAWPTEKNAMYHLGGTKFWELDFVTEPSAVLRTTTDKSKTIDVLITRTTCFDVILKSTRNSKAKSIITHRKRDVYNNRAGKNVFIANRDVSLKNITRKSGKRHKVGTKRSLAKITKKLKRDSQKLRRLNYSERSFEERRAMRFNDFRCASNEDSITAKSRKLCGVNAGKLKRQIVKHEDATGKHKKKQPAKSRALQNTNLHFLHNTDNCAANKRNKYKTAASVNSRVEKIDKKETYPNAIDHESPTALHERKIHNCNNCICNVASTVNSIKPLLNRMHFPLDEIKALNCSEYKEIQDEIVISMDSDVEEAKEFPQPRYNVESLKDQKYIKLEELEDNFNNDLELYSDRDVVSLPGLNLNLPCNQDGDGITWLSSVNRPSYTWKRTDGIALLGFVAENGDLELQNVNAKDTGNYTCVMTYMSPDNEDPVETAYEIHLQVVTLPRYVVHGESRYRVRSCDERDLDVVVTYLPMKLNSVVCEADVCNAYVLPPSCSRNRQITINILLVPSHIVKLMTIDLKQCNVFCLKAIQDKLSLTLSKNLQIFLGKTIIFRLPHYEQRLVPIVEKSSFARRKRGRVDANTFFGGSSSIGLFSGCPAGYGLRETRCVPCDVGTYSEDGISHCKRCPAGTYQPNHGARACRTCTNPMTKGCYNMLWNSFSAVMVTLASIGAMVSMCVLLVWSICCVKKKFCIKRMAGVVAREDALETEERVEEQPLIRDASENEDQWENGCRVEKKREKSYANKKRRKQDKRNRHDSTHVREADKYMRYILTFFKISHVPDINLTNLKIYCYLQVYIGVYFATGTREPVGITSRKKYSEYLPGLLSISRRLQLLVSILYRIILCTHIQ
ncbi:uncharacterized protein [Cardiocondyla obscurior]|uniref:uncharacterized protein isoform X4 n=1 Tax=Cardiocondyla obscurior TaxID=286306 RepID=UPI0039656335